MYHPLRDDTTHLGGFMPRVAKEKILLINLVQKFLEFKRSRKLLTPNGEQKYKTAISWISELRPKLLAKDFDRIQVETLAEDILKAMQKKLDISGKGRIANPATMLVYLAKIRGATAWGKSHLALELPSWDLPTWGEDDSVSIALPDPFTSDEIKKILQTFADSQPEYFGFVYFLLSTACRPGEASALTWDKISDDFTQVTFSASFSRGKLRQKTKNKKPRTISISEDLSEMLQTRICDRTGFIFTNAKGLQIHDVAFRRIWEKALQLANVRYRKPYSTRHTAISHALDSGVPARDVAAGAGHGLEIMLRHYDRSLKKTTPFVSLAKLG